jgi:hypothetical protein
MTLTIYSWCSFTTHTISCLLKLVPEIACDILDETSDYLFYLCYQFLLYFLSGFLNGLTSVSFGVNLARRQIKYQQPETYTRALQREIKFRGLTKLHRSGISLDRYLVASGVACVFVFFNTSAYPKEPEPIGERFINWIINSGVKPTYEFARNKIRKPPDGFLTKSLCFFMVCSVFARIGFTVYGRILGVRLGIIKVPLLGKRTFSKHAR